MNCGNKKIILGCGNDIREGFIGLDIGDYGQEILRDLRKGLPLCDNSCEHLIADQVLEHIQSNEDFIFVMNECLRVLKQGGIFEIRVPNFESKTAYKDPTHCRFFTDATFTYLLKDNRWEYGFDKRWVMACNEIIVSQLYIVLVANKEELIKTVSIKIEEVKVDLQLDVIKKEEKIC